MNYPGTVLPWLLTLTKLLEQPAGADTAWVRNLRVALPFAILAFVLGAAFDPLLSAYDAYDRVAYPLLAAALSALWLVLMLRANTVVLVNTAIVTGTGLFFVTKLIALLFYGPSTQILGELTETFYWLPALYILASFVQHKFTRNITTLSFCLVMLVSLTYVALSGDGSERARVLFALAQLNLANVTLYALTFTGASTERRRKEEMRRVAVTDTLTGLLNRLGLKEQLQMTLEEARAAEEVFALLFLDLDGFKAVNDTLGHDVGDELLREVAARLRSIHRPNDAVARLGGDEFVIIARNLQRGHARELVRRLQDVITEPFELTQGLRVNASIGTSEFPADGHNADSLLSAADARMYEVKRARKAAA